MKQKGLRKLVSMILAVVMILSMSATAFADETTYTITIKNDTSGYTYTAYQIFDGDLYTDDDSNKILSNIVWGSAIAENDQSTALNAVQAITLSDESTPFADCTSAADIAAVLSGKSNESEIAQAFAEAISRYISNDSGTASTEGTDSYTISDLSVGYYLVETTELPGSGDGAYTRYILTVVGDSEVETKSDVPTVDKAVDEKDANIGDTVTYTLTATLPSNYADYESYKLIFHDTLSSGLTFESDTLTVTVDETTVLTEGTDYTVVTSDQTITVTINDLKTSAPSATSESEIVVTYKATLNGNAVIGGEGNPNEVCLEYSNNPNGSGSESTGITTTDKVVTWTFELDVTKKNNSETNLEGVEFKLYYTENVTEENSDGSTTTTSVKHYVIVDDKGKVTGWTTNENEASVLVSDSDGTFSVIGLDQGTYYLEEIKTLNGYNLLTDPITIVITATYAEGDDTDDVTELTKLAATANGESLSTSVHDGTVSASIVNYPGSTLPSTGGIGTTIFYIIGGVLVAGAAVLLVTKKRLGKME